MPAPSPGDATTTTGFAARLVALDTVGNVLRRGRPLDEALDGHRGLAALAPRDRAFAMNLATTVLRRLGQIDALIETRLARPLPARASDVLDLLRLGVAQLTFLQTPAHAAVNTTVALAQRRRHSAHVPLINAVLRRLAETRAAALVDEEAARMNTPDWLWRSWVRAYGADEARAIAEAHLREPPLDLTPSRPDASCDLAMELQAEQLPTGTLRLAATGPITELPGFAEGRWWVQDAAAALPARLLGDVDGQLVLDLCAAPGGKTAQLVSAGARVVAVDRSPARLRRTAENLKRLRMAATLIEADVLRWRPDAPVDRVLLDVPCSATGTIRRHPDVARLKTPAEVLELAAVQKRLLAAAIDMLAPGGLLVYCACSLQPDEGAAVVDGVIADGAPVARRSIAADEVGGLGEILTATGDLRTLPSHLAGRGGLDGFYAARLQRAS